MPGWHNRQHTVYPCRIVSCSTYKKTHLYRMSLNAWKHALVHKLASVHLCPSTPQDYLLWHVSQLHKHTHMVRLPLVICAAAWCSMMWPTGVSPRGPLHLKSLYSSTHTHPHTPQCQIRMAMWKDIGILNVSILPISVYINTANVLLFPSGMVTYVVEGYMRRENRNWMEGLDDKK